jgi:RHS repeat-associated protein
LIAETTAAGALVKEYAWIGDVPLAVMDGAGYHYVHADHLDTPRLAANSMGATVWRWDQQEPFGSNVPDENPSGLGTFDLPLRLPGQYFDNESGLFHNVSRDYDPAVARYIQADRLGVIGLLRTLGLVSSAMSDVQVVPVRMDDLISEPAVPFTATSARNVSGGLSLFAYVNNSPLNLIDPTGEFSVVTGGPPEACEVDRFAACRSALSACTTFAGSHSGLRQTCYSQYARCMTTTRAIYFPQGKYVY